MKNMALLRYVAVALSLLGALGCKDSFDVGTTNPPSGLDAGWSGGQGGDPGTGGSVGSDGTPSTGDTPGTAGTFGTGGLTGRGGAGGASEDAPASGGAPGSGDATGSGGASGSGGSGPPRDAGVAADGGAAPMAKPRVLLISPAANQLRACDADGQTVADYGFALDFGPSYRERRIWLGGRSVRWDAPPSPGAWPLNDQDPSASRILIEADPILVGLDAQLDAQLKVLTVDGKVATSYPVPPRNHRLILSPRGNYLYVATTDSQACRDCSAVVLRSEDGSPAVQGIITMYYPLSAMFSPDDMHFVYVPFWCEEALRVANLSDGQTASVPAASLACPGLAQNTPLLQGLLTDGAIVSERPAPSSNGHRLWFVDWQGQVTPLDSVGAPSSADEGLLQVHPGGRRALWSRSSNGVAETFEFESATLQSQPFVEPHPECYGQAATTRFELQGQSILACPCGLEACTPFAMLPTLEEPYSPTLVVSPDQRFVAVRYEWYLDRLPQSEAQALLYDAQGTVLQTLPNGAISFDRTSALAVDCYSVGSADQDCALINLKTARVTTLSGVNSYGFVYE
jgi:hypothetical protein